MRVGYYGPYKPRPLTDRQIEVVKLLATGAQDKDVARKLNVSIHTAFCHRHSIFKKLRIESWVEIVHYAIRRGYVPLMEFKEMT